MDVDREAARLAVATAAVPVVVNGGRVALLRLVSPYRGGSVLLTRSWLPGPHLWLDVVMVAPAFAVLASMLVAPVAAFVVAVRADTAAGPVIAGFAIGAAVLALGTVATTWAGYATPAMGYARFGVWLAVLFAGAASLGALAGDAVGPLFRAPDDPDEEHPRW